ncbi:MAG: HNH endonuclease [Verrucomicrobiota bacterium JB022]|nr:HNH endonuclease [Verrucomicrobiota bacterium JB022]
MIFAPSSSTEDTQVNDERPSFRRVLVLNRNWQAVNIIGVRRAFTLLWQDHARVINTFDGQFLPLSTVDWLEFSEAAASRNLKGAEWVRTIRRSILMPKVLLLNDFDRLPITEVKFNRQSVFERDNFTCQYTGQTFRAKDLTLDHVIPRERGGRTSWENIVTCSREINARKANRLPHEAGLRLIRKPSRPKWRPFAAIVAGSDIDASWAQFLHVEKSAS